MIVWCGRCDAEPVVLVQGEPTGLDWFGHMSERPWCVNCVRYAILGWPSIGVMVAAPVTRRQIRDADTCGMGDERPCVHGVRAGRYCIQCDTGPGPYRRKVHAGPPLPGEILPPDTNHGGDRVPGRYA